jgi:hypothetical protein
MRKEVDLVCNVEHYADICLEGPRKDHVKTQDRWPFGRNSNLAPPEYK